MLLTLSKFHCSYRSSSTPTPRAPQAAKTKSKARELLRLLRQAQVRIQQEKTFSNSVTTGSNVDESSGQSERPGSDTTDTSSASVSVDSKRATISNPFVDISGIWSSTTDLDASALKLTETDLAVWDKHFLECLGSSKGQPSLTSNKVIYYSSSSRLEVLCRIRAFLEKF